MMAAVSDVSPLLNNIRSVLD